MDTAASLTRRRGLSAVGMAVAAGLVVFSVLDFLGSYFGGKTDLASLQRATFLASGNASYHSQLGRYLQLTDPDLQRALREFQTAVRLNPNDASAWFDLVRVQQILGNPREQEIALENAERAAPKKPDVAWEAGNFFLARGDREKAMRAFRIVIENEPAAAGDAIDFLWRIQPDAAALLEHAVPPTPDAYSVFLIHLMSKPDKDSAAIVWAALLGLQKPFQPIIGEAYTSFLIVNHEPEAARQAWQQMAPLCGLIAYLPGQNLIVNPRFELEVLNAGFDWHYDQLANVKINLDANAAPRGSQSLVITFEGPSIKETGLTQYVSLAPNSQYQFSAHFKTDELEGAGGPVFQMQDETTGVEYFTTETLKNPGSWREVTAHFQTGPDAKMARLKLIRVPSGNAIRGHLWLDEVQLVRLDL